MVRVALAAALAVSVAAAPNADVFGRAVNSTGTSSSVASTATTAPITPPSGTSTTATSLASTAASTNVAASTTSGSITPVPTGVLPDDYFIKGNTPRTWSQALALAAKFVAPMSIEEKGG